MDAITERINNYLRAGVMSFTFGNGGPASSVLPGVMSGWQDWNDIATATTPITLSASPVGLTNDGLGLFTNLDYKVNGHGNIWDTTANQFDWSSLNLGDTVDFRLDALITTSSPNVEITTEIELAIGTAGPYTLSLDRRNFKTAGTYEILRWSSVYMGDQSTLTGGARFVMSADGAATVQVLGWYVRTLVR